MFRIALRDFKTFHSATFGISPLRLAVIGQAISAQLMQFVT